MEITYDEAWHWLLGSHGFPKQLYYMFPQPYEDIEFVLKYMIALTYGWDSKVVKNPYGLAHY